MRFAACRPTCCAIQNHADVVSLLMKYDDYGQYDDESRQVAKAGMDYSRRRVCESNNERLALVFDSDETTLSNWMQMITCGVCDHCRQSKYYPSVNDPRIVPILELYQLVQKLVVKIFFIIYRGEQDRQATIADINGAGYHKWKQLMIRRNDYTQPAGVFKSAQRQMIVNSGFTIALNIGDEASDLVGWCSERSFKLPNLLYLVLYTLLLKY